MSCIRITIRRKDGLRAGIHPVFCPLRPVISRCSGIRVSASLVCTLSTPAIGNSYLRAAPDVLWVSPELVRELLVESNVQWTIL